MTDRLDRASVVALTLTAAYFTLGVLRVRAHQELGTPANDIYAYVYPASVYAWRAIRDGAGLFWNPYQDCGQPFFAVSQTGLLYPVNLVFFFLDREPALLASVWINLAIAGAGAFLLGRSMGLGVAAALCGALAFQLAGYTVQLAAWTPIHIATYAWMPVVLWRTERLVKEPSVRGGIWLGLVITLQLLPGFPQIVFFTYQLIALRMAWALLTRETDRPLPLLACTGLGLVVAPLLAAIQLLPALEVARESLRSSTLPASDVGPGFGWKVLLDTVNAYGFYPGDLLIVLLVVVALIGSPPGTKRRYTVYYGLIAALYLILSVGPGTLLFALYEWLPLGTLFRGSARLLWVTSFAMAVLAGLGVEALLAPAGPARRRAAGVAVLAVGALLFILAPTGPRWSDAVLGLVVLGSLVLLSGRRGASSLDAAVAGLLVIITAANGLFFSAAPVGSLRTGDLYGGAAPAFAFVRERLTPQDRVLIIGRYGMFPDFALSQKSASLHRVPAIFDYEPQASRSYAEFFTYMRTGRNMQHLNDWYWVFDKLLPATLQRPLFDLTGARYVMVDRTLDQTPQVLTSGTRLLTEAGYVRIYENEQALPRARYVPRIAVVPPGDVLPRLTASDVDPRRVALVSEAPRSGFLGAGNDASGDAEIVADDSERVVIRVRATAPGFLLLADQYFPGWTARVDGVEQQILRANHTFRIVQVPAGDSEVVFAYRPASVRLGALISLATAAVLVAIWARAKPVASS